MNQHILLRKNEIFFFFRVFKIFARYNSFLQYIFVLGKPFTEFLLVQSELTINEFGYIKLSLYIHVKVT